MNYLALGLTAFGSVMLGYHFGFNEAQNRSHHIMLKVWAKIGLHPDLLTIVLKDIIKDFNKASGNQARKDKEKHHGN